MALPYPSETWLKSTGFMTPNYEFSQPTIDIIISNHITIHLKYIEVPVHYVHDKYSLLAIDSVKLKTTIQ